MTIVEEIGAVRRTLFRSLARRVTANSTRSMRELQLLRLVAIGETSTQADIAERLLMDAPAVSRLVAVLVADGLLEQRPGKDRRCVCLAVTRKAAKEVEVMEAGMRWLEGHVKASLGGEAKRVSEAMRKLHADLLSEALPTATRTEEKVRARSR